MKKLADFPAAAEKTNETLTVPDWPQTPIAVQGEINTAIAKANAALDAIGKQDLSKVTSTAPSARSISCRTSADRDK